MNEFDDLPWSPVEMEDYRKGGTGKTFKYHWKGWGPKEIENLWCLWGGHASPNLIECPDCGRPADKLESTRHFLGRCFNCWKENAYPGWQAKAIARLNGKSGDEKPEPQFKSFKGDIK